MGGQDRLFLLGEQPVGARNQRVVLVDSAVARPPIVELGTRDAEPANETAQRQLGALVQRGKEVDDDRAAAPFSPSGAPGGAGAGNPADRSGGRPLGDRPGHEPVPDGRASD